MNIDIHLSSESIESAIRKLTRLRDNIGEDSTNLAEILAREGAEQAQIAYGDYPVEAVALPGGDGEAYIVVHGDMPTIGEFGAGDATVIPGGLFENDLPDVRRGTWSEGHARQLVTLGKWFFAGEWMSEVTPHLGLYQAKEFIVSESTRIAQEVFQID